MSTESKTVLRAAAAPDLVRMQEANRMCAHCWFVSPRLDLCISMSVVLNTGHMCLVLLCVCVRMCVWRVPWGVWYYPAWCAPGSASITASNASPGEHDITHTYTRSHRGDPHWAKFPLAPPARQRLYIYLYVCVWVCVSTVCQPIESMLSPESLSAGAPAAANQPASQSKCLICSLSVDRPITGRISQEGPATWVRTVALATSIIILEAGEGEKDFFLLFFNKSAKKGGYILWIFRSDIWKYSNLEISCVSSLLHFLNTRVHGWNKGASPAVSKLCCPISSSTGGGYRGVCIPFLVLYSWPPECIIVKTWNNTLKFTESYI